MLLQMHDGFNCTLLTFDLVMAGNKMYKTQAMTVTILGVDNIVFILVSIIMQYSILSKKMTAMIMMILELSQYNWNYFHWQLPHSCNSKHTVAASMILMCHKELISQIYGTFMNIFQ